MIKFNLDSLKLWNSLYVQHQQETQRHISTLPLLSGQILSQCLSCTVFIFYLQGCCRQNNVLWCTVFILFIYLYYFFGRFHVSSAKHKVGKVAENNLRGYFTNSSPVLGSYSTLQQLQRSRKRKLNVLLGAAVEKSPPL